MPAGNAAMREVAGGYFTWVTLPAELEGGKGGAEEKSAAEVLAERCLKEENVTIAPGKIFEVPEDSEVVSFGHSIRLCWSWEDEEKLVEGIERIAKVARRMMGEAGRKGRETDEGGRDELRKGYVLVRR